MKIRTILGSFIMLLVCSCSQQVRKGQSPIESGIRIENGINRGVGYTDVRGKEYNLRYIPIRITNDTTVAITIQIAFEPAYTAPNSNSKEQFKLIPLPREWALDGVDVSENMIQALPTFIDKPSINETIEPGGKLVMAIGSLYPKNPDFSGVLPNTLFTQGKNDLYKDCPGPIDPIKSTRSDLKLGLKLRFGENCSLIPCGYIKYLNQ